MPDHLTSPVAEHRYKRFADDMKGSLKQAEDLAKFRNNIIHFHGLYDPIKGEAEILNSAAEIEAKAFEMHDLEISIFANALNLRDDDNTITFVGNHELLKAKSGKVP
ncbi:MAG TPA: hypothetical protein VGK48_17585 [Terriglobia bacterium]